MTHQYVLVTGDENMHKAQAMLYTIRGSRKCAQGRAVWLSTARPRGTCPHIHTYLHPCAPGLLVHVHTDFTHTHTCIEALLKGCESPGDTTHMSTIQPQAQLGEVALDSSAG